MEAAYLETNIEKNPEQNPENNPEINPEKNSNILWHDAFFEALQLEFYNHQNHLDFIKEHQLSKEALKMDALVIKKKPGVYIDKNIGQIFRNHNIFEYKPESSSLTARDYSKTMGYAFLYSAFTPVPVSDITVSFAVTAQPRNLFKYLKDELGLNVQEAGQGIYKVEGGTFPVQILVGKQLPPEENLFLRNLRSNLSAEDLTETAEAYKGLKLFEAKNVYFDRLVQANYRIFKEAVDMSESTREAIFKVLEEGGWLEERYKDMAHKMANEMANKRTSELASTMKMHGEPIEKIAMWTKLSADTIKSLA